MTRRPPRYTRTDTLFPYTPLFRSGRAACMTAHRRGSAAPLGIGHGHAVFQPGRQRKAQAMAWAARDQRQLLAVVEQLLVAGDAPEREGGGILRRISEIGRAHV